MRLWREIYEQLEENGDDGNVLGLRYTVSAGKGGYFQNVKGIGGFSPCEITLCLSRGKVKITGTNLCVKKYCENDVLIGGDILCVSRCEE